MSPDSASESSLARQWRCQADGMPPITTFQPMTGARGPSHEHWLQLSRLHPRRGRRAAVRRRRSDRADAHRLRHRRRGPRYRPRLGGDRAPAGGGHRDSCGRRRRAARWRTPGSARGPPAGRRLNRGRPRSGHLTGRPEIYRLPHRSASDAPNTLHVEPPARLLGRSASRRNNGRGARTAACFHRPRPRIAARSPASAGSRSRIRSHGWPVTGRARPAR